MRVLVFTGKGGAGATTLASATAVRASRLGVKTLLLSLDPARGPAPGSLFDAVPDAGQGRDDDGPVEIEPGLFVHHLDAPQRAEHSWAGVQVFLRPLLDTIGLDPLVAAELTAVPGAREALALFELRDQVPAGRWDLIVVDAGPTDRAVRLLTLADSLSSRLGRLLPPERRIARALSRSAREPGTGVAPPGDAVVEAIGRFQAELAGAAEVLRVAYTSVRLVLTPESGAIAELRRTITSLALFGYDVGALMVNRVFPAGGNDPWQQGWAAAQRQVLAQLTAAFQPADGRSILCTPYLSQEPVGVTALAALADELYAGTELEGDLDADLFPPATLPPSVQVERCADGFVLLLRLPCADRRDVDLSRRGDELVVAAHGVRRELTLPSALRRCRVVEATLRGGSLRISFEPDPALWRSL